MAQVFTLDRLGMPTPTDDSGPPTDETSTPGAGSRSKPAPTGPLSSTHRPLSTSIAHEWRVLLPILMTIITPLVVWFIYSALDASIAKKVKEEIRDSAELPAMVRSLTEIEIERSAKYVQRRIDELGGQVFDLGPKLSKARIRMKDMEDNLRDASNTLNTLPGEIARRFEAFAERIDIRSEQLDAKFDNPLNANAFRELIRECCERFLPTLDDILAHKECIVEIPLPGNPLPLRIGPTARLKEELIKEGFQVTPRPSTCVEDDVVHVKFAETTPETVRDRISNAIKRLGGPQHVIGPPYTCNENQPCIGARIYLPCDMRGLEARQP